MTSLKHDFVTYEYKCTLLRVQMYSVGLPVAEILT